MSLDAKALGTADAPLANPMRLLHGRVPLTLLMDLALPFSSDDIYTTEGTDGLDLAKPIAA